MVRPARLTSLLLLALVACTRSSTESSVTSPSGPRCAVGVTSSLETAPASGGSGTLDVTTDRDCTWAASSEVGWITFTAGASGQGNGTATFRVAANTETVTRRASLSVNDRAVSVVQAAACRYDVSPLTLELAAAGGTADVRVEAGAACEWTATTDVDWIRVLGGGAGAGVATVEVQANPGGNRAARVAIAGQTVTVTQAAVPVAACTYSIDPLGQAVPQNGGAVDVTVTTAAACAWTAAANVPWITIVRNPSGTGPSTVSLAVASNPGAARSGTATIAGLAFTVTQSPQPCAYALGATSVTMPAVGGNGSVGVVTAATCDWSAAANVPWITVTSNATGTGNATVAFAVGANSGAARTGTLTVAGLTYTVSQAAAAPVCSFTVNPPTRTIDRDATNGSFTVTTAAGCAWTAVVPPSVDWFTITAGTSGSGTGSVNYRVDRNRGSSRMVTVQVMTQTFKLTQRQ